MVSVLPNWQLPQGRHRVILLTTGGTIEKSYDEGDGSLANRGSFIKHLLTSKLRLPYTTIESYAVMSMDSLHMTDEHRLQILNTVQDKAQLGCPIVVLHGTDSLALTARFCQERFPETTVPVIFTGSMKPVGFVDSDAIQNVTESLAFSKVVPPGFYISFHGQIFDAHMARKNVDRLTFESTTSPATD